MKQKPKSRSRARGARVITTLSVALVLTVIGIVALIGRMADTISDSLRSGLGMVVVVAEEATAPQLDSLVKELKTAPYVASTTYTTAEEINTRMRAELGEEELADVNPFQAEYNVKVKPQWSSADSLTALAAKIGSMSAVYEVAVHTEMVNNVNHTISTVVIVLIAIAAVLLVISFVLIFNTVSMQIYAQRMIIHTMQYVGATKSFILRPYILRSVVTGLLAGLTSTALLAAMVCWGFEAYPEMQRYLSWIDFGLTAGALTAAGAIICAIATSVAASRQINRTIDEIFEH